MCALYFKHTVANFQNAHVEGSATKVEYQNGFVFAAFVEAVCQSCSGWFVDNTQHFKTSDLPCFFCCSALCIVEVRGNGNNSLRDGVTQVSLGVALQLHECAGADFLWCVLLAIDIGGLPVFAHVALH